MSYKIHIEDRNYNTWSWHEIENMKDVTQEFNCNPIEKKLFTYVFMAIYWHCLFICT